VRVRQVFRVRVGVGRRLGLKSKGSFYFNLDSYDRANNKLSCVWICCQTRSSMTLLLVMLLTDYLNEIMKVKQHMQMLKVT
jgi:hypothetical protein